MKLASFTIKVHNIVYTIQPSCEVDCTLYEVFTNCEKLFTLKKASNGNWITDEKDIIPISEDLIEDIGEAVEEYEYQL
jgi:hypothetical protein